MTRDPDEVYIQVRRDRRSPVQMLPETAKDPTPAQIEQRLRLAAAAELARKLGLKGDEQRKFVAEQIRGRTTAPHRVREPKWKQHVRRRYGEVLAQERGTPVEERHFTDEQLDKIARALGGGG